MGDLVSIAKNDADILNKEENNEAAGAGASYSRALVPTVDIYTARLFFNFTRNIVEETVDRRVSLLEEKIKDRDQELMRAIRKLQARLAMQQQNKAAALPWWRKLFNRGVEKREK
ncbi:MAG: hypothetical protein RJR37_11420 [Peptococcaceae bacterium MAG4]|jgi:hypothetical protein|nr:hypothetical protein [Peptococcaceae bacterium MAG4]HQD76492.1 hypothetical protein [Bacillota bacterium]